MCCWTMWNEKRYEAIQPRQNKSGELRDLVAGVSLYRESPDYAQDMAERFIEIWDGSELMRKRIRP